MNRLVVVLAVLVAALWMIDHFTRSSRTDMQRRESTVRPLVALADTAVRSIEIIPPEPHPSWRFERREHWVYPAYHAVHADEWGIERLLATLVGSTCTVVGPEEAIEPRHGLARDQALRFRLTGTRDDEVEVWVGHGIPTEGAAEAYVRLADADSIYHLHANPRPLLADRLGGGDGEAQDRPMWRQVPFLDPRVLPRSTAPAPVIEVRFVGIETQESPARLWQVQADGERHRAAEPPPIEWRLRAGGRERRCVTTQAFAYVQFLARLSYETAESPAAWQQDDRGIVALEIADAGGGTHRLEIGEPRPSGKIALRNASTGYVYTISPSKAAMLIPTVSALVDSLAGPPAYELLEPRRPFD